MLGESGEQHGGGDNGSDSGNLDYIREACLEARRVKSPSSSSLSPSPVSRQQVVGGSSNGGGELDHIREACLEARRAKRTAAV